MTPEDSAVSVARLEARLDGIKLQIDQQDRNQQQLVRLFDERMVARFDSIDKRLDAMDRARDESRAETTKLREVTEGRLKELEATATAKVEATAKELHDRIEVESKRSDALENFNARLIGVALGASVLSGGVFAAVSKALGG